MCVRVCVCGGGGYVWRVSCPIHSCSISDEDTDSGEAPSSSEPQADVRPASQLPMNSPADRRTHSGKDQGGRSKVGVQ